MVNGELENLIFIDDFLFEMFDVYLCLLRIGFMSECVMFIFRDVVRVVLVNVESRDGNWNIEWWKKFIGFGIGVCVIVGLDWYMKVYGGVDDDIRVLVMNCLKFLVDYVR